MHCAECYQLICVLIDILEFDCLRTVMRYNYHKITFHCPVTSLGPDDLNDVRRELLDVSKKWYDIGLELRLQPGDLENIECQNQDVRICLRKMLLHWLKKVDPPPHLGKTSLCSGEPHCGRATTGRTTENKVLQDTTSSWSVIVL